MNLRATRFGYTYQDLITGIALVDLMRGTAVGITVDSKGLEGQVGDRTRLPTVAVITERSAAGGWGLL